MNNHAPRIAAIALGGALLCLSGESAAQSPNCQNVQFSQAVLAEFPRAREGCLDVIRRDGKDYAVYKAELLRVYSDDRVRVRFKHPDGSRGDARTIATPRDFRVLVQGKPVPLSEVTTGQELTAYVHVTEPVIALAPVTESEPLQPMPMEPERQQVAAMPTTASLWPTLGAMGLLGLAAGALLRRLRAGLYPEGGEKTRVAALSKR